MTSDHELLFLHLAAVVFFGAIALFLDGFLLRLSRARKLRPPPRTLRTFVRLWFAALCAGSLYLLLQGPQGLFARR